jgi:hypothetical protein
MSPGPEYTTETARAAAERDELAEWVTAFLASPGSDNAPLAEALADPPRWWLGPVEVPLDQLNRLAGPPGHPVVQEVEDHEWRDDVEELADQVDDGHRPPPVIATETADGLKLEDGNHRVEALRRAGVTRAWTIVGFDDPEARDRFLARAGEASTG